MKFTRGSRLTEQAEYRRVFARPEVSQDRYFRILRRCNDLGRARLGLAVSVKVCKHAVGRNRLKRLVRESFRLHQQALAQGGGLDFVVLPSHRAVGEDNQVLTNSLAKHWEKAGAIDVGSLPLDNKGSIHQDG